MIEPRDESTFFSFEEFVTAFLQITDRAEAETIAADLSHPRAPDDVGGAWQLAPDVLDLLSLVSPSCAARAQSILKLSDADMQSRIAAARQRYSIENL